MAAVRVPAEQDVAGVWFAGQFLPWQCAWRRRISADVPVDSLDSPVGQRDDPLAVIFGQGKYITAAKVLDLPPDAQNFLVKIKVFHGDAE